MRMLNAWTLEVDEPQLAIAEIKEQLDLANQLQKHAAGFITCSYDFVETGMVEAICQALPFAVVGCTTLSNGVNNQAVPMLLCLSVLTADDCQFSTVLSEPLTGDLDSIVGQAWKSAQAGLDLAPGLVIPFMPLIATVGGELILNALDNVAQIPVFGTIACDHDTAQYSNTFTIYNGICSRDSMAMLVVAGNITPRFVVTSTSEQNLQKQKAIITSSHGSVMREVNNIPTHEYLKTLGFMPGPGGGVDALSSIPFVVDYQDGTQPVARAIYRLNEDGSAICGGVMPEGSSLSIGRMDVPDILFTAEQSLTKLIAHKDINGIIMFPCLGRNMILGMEPLAEVEKVQEAIGNKLPWHLAYSGGEICPVYDESGATFNRFHNFTFIACAI